MDELEYKQMLEREQAVVDRLKSDIVKVNEPMFVIKTSGREVLHNGETVCSWSEGIFRSESRPCAIFSIGHTFFEKLDNEEITKEQLIILRDSFDMIIKDAEAHGL